MSLHLQHAVLAWMAVLGAGSAATGCDLCQLYSRPSGRATERFQAGVSLQSSDFGTLRFDGQELDNAHRESLSSSIAQAVLAVRATPALTVQVNLPWIDRSYRRVGEEGIERGTERGGGDVALVARYDSASRDQSRTAFHWSVLAGLELPSGAGDRLGEELEHHDEVPAARPPGPRAHAHELESGVHGHDLALGNGAIDLLFGAGARWSSAHFEFDSRLQYARRGTGDFEYRFADDVHVGLSSSWVFRRDGGPEWSVGIGLVGEHKGKDRLGDEVVEDTAITAIYAGPLASFHLAGRVAAQLALDLPISQDNSALQIVPDRRLRFALTASF